MLARASKLSVFDEPEAGIDLWSFQNLIQVFERMRKNTNGSILIISHQERILNIADEIVVIADGKIVNHGSRDEIMPQIMAPPPRWMPAASFTIRIKSPYGKGDESKMDEIQERILMEVADLHGVPEGAYNIRANGKLASRSTTANIDITTKEDVSGIDIRIKPGTKHESVHIPVVVSESGLKDMVYNDFYIGEDCDVVIVAGCGIHNSATRTRSTTASTASTWAKTLR